MSAFKRSKAGDLFKQRPPFIGQMIFGPTVQKPSLWRFFRQTSTQASDVRGRRPASISSASCSWEIRNAFVGMQPKILFPQRFKSLSCRSGQAGDSYGHAAGSPAHIVCARLRPSQNADGDLGTTSRRRRLLPRPPASFRPTGCLDARCTGPLFPARLAFLSRRPLKPVGVSYPLR